MIIRGVLFVLGIFAAICLGVAVIALIADWVDLTVFGLMMAVGFLLLWGGALYDIWRRADLSGGSRILWTLAIFLLPVVGTLVYALARPAAGEVRYRGEQVA